MGNLLLSFLLAFNVQSIDPPSPGDSAITQTLMRFFEAMNKGDSTTLSNLLPENGIMQTVTEREGRVVLIDGNRDNFISRITELKGQLTEEVSNLRIMQDGPMATVWMDYQFFFQGDLHHCGVNMFHMARIEESWKVIYVCDTRRTCE